MILLQIQYWRRKLSKKLTTSSKYGPVQIDVNIYHAIQTQPKRKNSHFPLNSQQSIAYARARLMRITVLDV